MKKFAVIAMAALMIAAFAGCGKKADTAASDTDVVSAADVSTTDASASDVSAADIAE